MGDTGHGACSSCFFVARCCCCWFCWCFCPCFLAVIGQGTHFRLCNRVRRCFAAGFAYCFDAATAAAFVVAAVAHSVRCCPMRPSIACWQSLACTQLDQLLKGQLEWFGRLSEH